MYLSKNSIRNDAGPRNLARVPRLAAFAQKQVGLRRANPTCAYKISLFQRVS
jgi:hypothetical protein